MPEFANIIDNYLPSMSRTLQIKFQNMVLASIYRNI